MFRIVFHSTPAKKGCAFTSAVEFRPRRVSGAVSMLEKISEVSQDEYLESAPQSSEELTF